MATAEINGREFEIPDDWTPEQTKERIFGQFPELDPNRSVVKSGLAKGAQAYSDVVTAGSELAASTAATLTSPETLKTAPPSYLGGEAMLVEPTKLTPEEESTRRQHFQKIVQPIKNANAVRDAYWQQVVEETSPVIDPENKASSIAKVAASDAIGLILETPLFAVGGSVGAKAASFVPGTGKIAQGVRAMLTTGGAFGGEAVLRGQEGGEIAAATATGALVGPAGALAPTGTKTIAETAALLAGQKYFHGEEITAETWAATLATLVELKLLHKVTGKSLSSASALKDAIRMTKDREKITPEQEKALVKAAFEVDLGKTADKIVEETLKDGGVAKEEAVPAGTKPEPERKAPEESGIVDIAHKDVGDRVYYTDERGNLSKGLIESKVTDKFGSVREFRVRLDTGESVNARPSAVEPTPEVMRARQERQIALEAEQKAAEIAPEKANNEKIQRLYEEADRLSKEIAENPYADPTETAAKLGRQEQILKEVAELIKKPELFQEHKERRAEDKDRRIQEEQVLTDRRNEERRTQRAEQSAIEAKAEAKLGAQPQEAAPPLAYSRQKEGLYVAKTSEGKTYEVKMLKRGEWAVTDAGKEVGTGKTYAEARKVLESHLGIKVPITGKKQRGAIDPDLLLPKKLREGALKLNKEVTSVLKLAREINKARVEKGELDFEVERTRFNNFYKVGLTLLQVADLNKDVVGLQDYVHWNRSWSNEKRRNMHIADERVKEWNSLGKEDAKKLAEVLFEETNSGKAMTPEELAKTGLSLEGQALKERIAQDFKNFIDQVENAFLIDAARTLEGPQLVNAQKAIKADFGILRNKPYFPLMRWGKYSVTVRDRDGKVVEFHTRENILEQNLLWSELRRNFRPQGFTVGRGYVSDELLAFQGMPPRLVDRLTSELKLTEEQRDMLDNLQHKLAPSQSWRKHLLNRKGVKGYSEDAIRAYASYFFHGSNHLARLKYNDKLLNSIADVRRRARDLSTQGVDSRDHDRLSEFMDNHYKYIMTPQNEFASLRAAGFLWYLGFLPKAAVVNLTQVPLVSYPHLAAKFGDAKAVQEIARAYKSQSRGIAGRHKSLTPDEIRAMDKFLEDGLVDESFASTLAAVSEGRVISRLLPQSKTGRTVTDIAGRGAYLFSMAEQMNRRVVALAAYRLARKAGLEHEAAYVVGRDAIEKTQFEYANWNRPAFMRGKASVIFLFYQFLQNSLYFAARDPGNLRYLGMLLAAAGLEGLPFAEDLLDVFDRVFSSKNKKVDSRKELREFVQELGANPDLLMHGGGRYGLGIPWVARQASIPIPDFDISASLSMGRPLRVTEPLLSVTGDFARNFPEAFQAAGGALLSLPMEAWKVLDSNQPWSAKRMENVMPSILRSVSKAYRHMTTGEETTAGGVPVAKFDMNDPQDMTGVGLQAIGFIPTKVALEQERLYTLRETVTFYKERRQELLNYLDHAYSVGDKEYIKDSMQAIQRYNREVPYKLMAISGNDLVQSRMNKVRGRLTEGATGLPFGSIKNAEVTREYNKAFPKKGE